MLTVEILRTEGMTVTLAPGRESNDTYRSREYLTPTEAGKLIDAAGNRGRHRLRDRALLLLMYRHGLRVSEAANLKWDCVLLDDGRIQVNRLKGSNSGVHPLQADEIELLRQVREAYPDSPYVFVNERGNALTRAAIGKLIERCAEMAGLGFSLHPHMLRHSCGYYLANKGYDTRLIQEWMGHRNIQNTVGYTSLAADRFKSITW